MTQLMQMKKNESQKMLTPEKMSKITVRKLKDELKRINLSKQGKNDVL